MNDKFKKLLEQREKYLMENLASAEADGIILCEKALLDGGGSFWCPDRYKDLAKFDGAQKYLDDLFEAAGALEDRTSPRSTEWKIDAAAMAGQEKAELWEAMQVQNKRLEAMREMGGNADDTIFKHVTRGDDLREIRQNGTVDHKENRRNLRLDIPASAAEHRPMDEKPRIQPLKIHIFCRAGNGLLELSLTISLQSLSPRRVNENRPCL